MSKRTGQSPHRYLLDQLRTLLSKLLAPHEAARLTETELLEYLESRCVLCDGNTSGAGSQDAEEDHTPFGHVRADESDAVLRFDAFRGEKRRRPQRTFSEVSSEV